MDDAGDEASPASASCDLCGPIAPAAALALSEDAYPAPPDDPPPDEPYPGAETPAAPEPTRTPRPTATPTGAAVPEESDESTPTPTATATATPLPATATATLERVELATEAAPVPTDEPEAVETPDAGATLVVRAATRGALAPTDIARPAPDAPVDTGRLAGAAGVILVVVLGAIWWRRHVTGRQEPPEA